MLHSTSMTPEEIGRGGAQRKPQLHSEPLVGLGYALRRLGVPTKVGS